MKLFFIIFLSTGSMPEDWQYFPYGAWGCRLQKEDKITRSKQTLAFAKCGLNFLLSQWESEFDDWWETRCEEYGIMTNLYGVISPHPYSTGWYSKCWSIFEHYPVMQDEDSLDFWCYLAKMLADTMKSIEGEKYVYSFYISSVDFLTHPSRPKTFLGIDTLCALLQNGSDRKTFIYGEKVALDIGKNGHSGKIDIIDGKITGLQFEVGEEDNALFQNFIYDPLSKTGRIVEFKKAYAQYTEESLESKIELWEQISIHKIQNPSGDWTHRRCTEAEARAIVNLALACGAKGIMWYPYKSYLKKSEDGSIEYYSECGITDKWGRPFMPAEWIDSIFGENSGITSDEINTNDSIFLYIWKIGRDIKDIGRALRKLEIKDKDTANVHRITQVPYEFSGDCLLSSLTVINGAPDDRYFVVTRFKDALNRDFVFVVNTHIKDKINYKLIFDDCARGWVVDMNDFKTVTKLSPYVHELKSGIIPGGGDLYAVINEEIPPPNKPWGVWAIIILEHNGTKYTIYTPWDRPDWLDEIDKNAEVTYTIKIAVRGELFRHGPRARDVDSVVVELWDIEGTEPVLLQDTTYREVYKNSLQYVEWADDKAYLFNYQPDTINNKKFGHSYNAYIKVKAYNSFGKLIDAKVFPFTPWWFVPGNTKHTCQRNDVDPDGKWYIAYTEETEDTPRVHLFTLGNNETISSGKFPTLAVKGDTIGVAFLSKNSDTIYYTYKIDSTWSSPYPIVSSLPHSLSVPRTGVYKDTVYLSYQKRTDLTSFSKILSEPGDNTGIYLERFPITKPEERVSQEVSTWYEDISDIEPRGAGIGVDNAGNIYITWKENNQLKFGIIYPSGDKRICGTTLQPLDPSVICPFPNDDEIKSLVPGRLFITNDKLILSLFHPADTTEILRDTLYEGNEIRSAKSVGGGVVFDEAGCIKFLKWDAVNNGISEVTELTQAQKSSYPSIDGVSYIKDNTIHRDYYLIWTEDVTGASFLPDSLKEDTLSMVATEILSYSGDGHEGLMPYVYLRGGFEPPSIFTLHRDSFAVYGDEIYEKVDIGYDSLVYEFPGSRQRIRMFFEFYTPDETYETSEVNLKINGLNLASFTIQPSEVERYELWIPDSLSLDTVRVFLKRLSGDYIPLSRMIVESFEIRDDGASYRGYSGIKEVRDYSTFSFYSLTNVISKGNALFFYTLPYGTQVKVKVYDVGGRLLRVLEDGYQEKGRYKMEWDLRDTSQRKAPKGVYFVRFEAGGYKRTEKILITQ